jgi:membrane-associated phospholipid phosphatase
MHKRILLVILIIYSSFELEAEDSIQYKPIPFYKAFYKMGNNAIGSFEYNYGLNYGLGSVGTYGIIKSGIDWKWNRFAKNNKSVSNTGMFSAILGGIVPLALPLGMYFNGRSKDDLRLQATGLALGQSAILALGISSGIKVFTGRKPPGILDPTSENSDYSADFDFGFLRRGAFNGWPSSHTTVAFAMASTLCEMYPDNTALKIGAYTYATAIGLGVSVSIHWFSDAFAGALIGYAIGKSVGRSFNQLLQDNTNEKNYSFFATPNSMGFVYRF